MSFGVGWGAGMGAGIGTGIAIGIASGRKIAVEQIKEYLISHHLTIHDSAGHEVELETVLNDIVQTRRGTAARPVVALIIGLLVGVALLATIAHFAM